MVAAGLVRLDVRLPLGGAGCGRACATAGDWALVTFLPAPALSEGWASTEAAGPADMPVEVGSAFPLLCAALLLR